MFDKHGKYLKSILNMHFRMMKQNLIFLRKYSFFFTILFLLSGNTYLPGQSPYSLPWYSTDDAAVREKIAAETVTSIRAKFREPEGFDRESKIAWRTQRDRLAQNIAEEIKENAVQDDVLWPFLKQTLQTIIAANPEIAGTKVILAANPMPNAFSIGDGTIIVYTGLLAGLENEDQVAFVLCHEIAHYLLEHSTKGLEKQIKMLHSKEFKKKIEETKALEYNAYEQLESIYKNTLFNARYHHRDLERQADSLAYRLFLKTPFETAQAPRLMQIFEYIDEPLRDSTLQVDTHFGCEQYRFQQKWLTKNQSSVWGEAAALTAAAEKSLQDSMCTHPDWKNRLQWIEAMAQTLPLPGSAKNTSAQRYSTIQFLSVLENTEAWFQRERYDRTLYYAVQYQRVYPDCSYFKEIQALSLYGLYSHSQNHTTARVLSESSPDYPEKYNQFLTLLNNLRLKDLLGLESCSTNSLSPEKTEYGLLAAYFLATAQEDAGKMSNVKRDYLSTFRKGRFVDFFKEDKK
jgi:Zn-dependent protease with chaperone function